MPPSPPPSPAPIAARLDRRRIQVGDEPSALALIEEAFHLLRQAPVRAWMEWLLGSVPWTAAAAVILCVISWFPLTGLDLLLLALPLVSLHLWLRATQARFCAHLAGFLDPSVTVLPLRRSARDLLVLSGPLLLGTAVAATLVLPLPFALIYAQQRLVLCARSDAPASPAGRHAQAWREARRGPIHVSFAAATLGLFILIMAVCGFGLFLLLGELASSLSGANPMMTDLGWADTRNREGALFWLCVLVATTAATPWWLAYGTLLHHRGRGRSSGSDLHAELARIRRERAARSPRRNLTALTAVLLALAASAPQPAFARGGNQIPQAPPAPSAARHAPPPTAIANHPSSVQLDAFDEAVREVLSRPNHRWRLPQPPKEDTVEASRIWTWLEDVYRNASRSWNALVKEFKEWLMAWKDRLLGKEEPNPEQTPETPEDGVYPDQGLEPERFRVPTLVWIALTLALVLGFLFMQLRQQRRRQHRDDNAQAGVDSVVPDLTAPRIDPAAQPWREWLRLAGAERQRGNLRGALRALFLARLARLGEEDLLAVNASKTNLAYERELTRKVPPGDPQPAAFRTHRLLFEAVWYGRAEADPALFDAWFQELGTAVNSASTAKPEAAA